MKNLAIILAISTFGLTLTSCKKDKENPVISVTTPAEHSHHNWGAHVDLGATFTDDRGLASYHIHMGDVDGNHLSSISFEETGTISGTSFDWTGHMMVPDSAPMMAYLHFEVTDAENKTSSAKWMLHFDE